MRPTTRAFMIVISLVFSVFISACGGGAPAPTQTPFIIVVTAPPSTPAGSDSGVGVGIKTPTPAASTAPTRSGPSVLPTRAPSTPSSSVKLATYTGSQAPFTIQYPSDWTVTDAEKDQRLVVIVSPDQASSLILTYAPAGNQTAEEALNAFMQNFNLPGLKLSEQKKNADGSVSAELDFNDPTNGAPIHGLLRVVRQATSNLFYVIIFGVSPDQFAQMKTLGTTLLNSFQERPSIVRQNTPPPVVSVATATPTLPPPLPPTDTPVPLPPPTDTPPPPPPPTNTPRPASAPYRVEVNVHDGYEDWGRAQDCQNYNPAVKSWKLSIDITFYNDSSRVIRPEEWYPSFFDGAGNELLTCYYPLSEANTAFPAVPAHDKRKMTFFAHSAQNQFVTEMRIQIGAVVLRRCFARNKRADVVGC